MRTALPNSGKKNLLSLFAFRVQSYHKTQNLTSKVSKIFIGPLIIAFYYDILWYIAKNVVYLYLRGRIRHGKVQTEPCWLRLIVMKIIQYFPVRYATTKNFSGYYQPW